MKRIARKSDGRRIFTAEFKHEQISRVLRGDLSLADLSKELGIARSLLQRWKRLEAGNRVKIKDAVTRPGTSLGGTQDLAYIRELHWLIGKQAMELEFLRTELEALRNARPQRGTRGGSSASSGPPKTRGHS